MEPSQPKNHEDHIANKGFYFDVTLQFGSQIYSYATKDENSGCNSCRGQGMEKARDNPSMATGKLRARRRLFSKHKETKRKSTLQQVWHLQNAKLEPKLQKDRGRVVLRGEIVEDDSGLDAVFNEQGSSSSQMTAAKVMHVIARFPDCDGQAADAVSAYTQVKLEDAPRLLKIPEFESADVWIRLPPHKWPKSLEKWKIPWYLLNEICTIIHYQDCYGKDISKKRY